MTIVHNLTELQYSTRRKGPFALYIFQPHSEYHAPPIWFEDATTPKYPEEGEVTIGMANLLANNAMADGREVRITDSGDLLVFHAKGMRVLYPNDAEKFWSEIA